MSIIEPPSEKEEGLGLFFGIIEIDRRPQVLWSGSTWHQELNTWDLLLKILAMKDKATLEEVGWNFLPILWDEIEIYAMAPEDECSNEIFVMMPWEKDGLAVPLMQLEVIHGNNETEEAVNDWKYWVACGYSFG